MNSYDLKGSPWPNRYATSLPTLGPATGATGPATGPATGRCQARDFIQAKMQSRVALLRAKTRRLEQRGPPWVGGGPHVMWLGGVMMS